MRLRAPRILPLAAAMILVLSLVASPLGHAAVRADSGLSISGTVVGSAGDLGGIDISGCSTDWSFCSGDALTDDTGNFSLGGLQPGSYVLFFNVGPHYLSGYYAGPGLTRDQGSATPVDVTNGSVILTVQLPVAYVISGAVTGAEGGLQLIEPSACDAAGQCQIGNTDEAGNYVIGGLSSGTYTILFGDAVEGVMGAGFHPYSSGYYTGTGLSPDSTAAIPVVIADSDVVLPTLDLPVGPVISGSVEGSAGNLGEIIVMACPVTYPGPCVGAMSSANGDYVVRGAWAEDYTLNFYGLNPTYLRGWYTPSGTVTQIADAAPVTVGAGGLTMAPFELQVAGTITGTVTGTAGHLGWISVSACPVGVGDCSWSDTNDDGTFTVDSLPQGTYTLSITDGSGYFSSGYYASPGVLVATADQATQFTVPPSVAGLVVPLTYSGAADVPYPPYVLAATPGNGTATVSWYAAWDNGSPVTGYTATASDGSFCVTTELSCVITGLTNGTAYTVTVIATNAIGTSDSSWMPVSVTPIGPVQTGVVKLVIKADSHTSVAGSPVSVTVSALDRKGKVVNGYTGTVHFSSTDLRGALPDDYTFTAADGGTHTFSVLMGTVGAQAITVNDGSLTTKRWAISVKAGPALRLVVTGPDSSTAGVGQRYRVLALDAFDNVATGCTDTVTVHSSDAALAMPAASFALVRGTRAFTANFKTAGIQALSVDDYAGNMLGYLDYITVRPGKAASISITGLPSSVTSGVASNATVTVHDKFGNVVTGYTGMVHFVSNDKAATLPADYTFTAADAGVHNFAITLTTTGNRWVTVRDTSKHSIGGTARVVVDPL